jgi:predicted enzyme related to lactoylglutathione lyase
MSIIAIDHIQLAIPQGEEEQARAFYAGLLEFTERPKPPQLAGRGGVWFEAGEVKLHLGVDAEFHPARKAHPAFLVHGLTRLLSRLEASGGQITRDVPLDGYERAHVTDPFGNRIELMEKTEP